MLGYKRRGDFLAYAVNFFLNCFKHEELRTIEVPVRDPEVRQEINRLATNFNQAVRALNTLLKKAPPYLVPEIERILKELEESHKPIKQFIVSEVKQGL